MAKMDEATRKRVRAGRLMLAGKSPGEAARAVGVARQAAYTWKTRLDEGGIDALRAMATGRPAKLDAGQLEGLRLALLQGAMAHGFGTELWTLKRVRALIEGGCSVCASAKSMSGACSERWASRFMFDETFTCSESSTFVDLSSGR